MDAPAEAPARVRSTWRHALVAVGVVVLTGVVLLLMGRVPVSKSGRILPWVGTVHGPENSQQIFDWYSFSHVIHGIAFYYGFRWLTRGRASPGALLVMAVAFEAAWEVFENTPFTIERYRKTTIALDYYGDSVLNSLCDVGCCLLGFFLAARLPGWASIVLVVATELFVLAFIRDNLALNILMFLYPVEAIRRWQQGAG